MRRKRQPLIVLLVPLLLVLPACKSSKRDSAELPTNPKLTSSTASALADSAKIEGLLAQRNLTVSAEVKLCIRTYLNGPGGEFVQQSMDANGLAADSEEVASLEAVAFERAVFNCDQTSMIALRLAGMSAALQGTDVPLEESRCVLTKAYFWAVEKQNNTFPFDPWFFNDQATHLELFGTVKDCGLSAEFVDYLLDPAMNPITDGNGKIVVPIRNAAAK